MIEKIIEEETTKGAWDKFKNLYDRDEKLKRVRLQTLRKQFEMTQMKEEESVSKYFSCAVLLTNHMKDVQCYNCQGFSHYARDFQRNKET